MKNFVTETPLNSACIAPVRPYVSVRDLISSQITASSFYRLTICLVNTPADPRSSLEEVKTL